VGPAWGLWPALPLPHTWRFRSHVRQILWFSMSSARPCPASRVRVSMSGQPRACQYVRPAACVSVCPASRVRVSMSGQPRACQSTSRPSFRPLAHMRYTRDAGLPSTLRLPLTLRLPSTLRLPTVSHTVSTASRSTGVTVFSLSLSLSLPLSLSLYPQRRGPQESLFTSPSLPPSLSLSLSLSISLYTQRRIPQESLFTSPQQRSLRVVSHYHTPPKDISLRIPSHHGQGRRARSNIAITSIAHRFSSHHEARFSSHHVASRCPTADTCTPALHQDRRLHLLEGLGDEGELVAAVRRLGEAPARRPRTRAHAHGTRAHAHGTRARAHGTRAHALTAGDGHFGASAKHSPKGARAQAGGGGRRRAEAGGGSCGGGGRKLVRRRRAEARAAEAGGGGRRRAEARAAEAGGGSCGGGGRRRAEAGGGGRRRAWGGGGGRRRAEARAAEAPRVVSARLNVDSTPGGCCQHMCVCACPEKVAWVKQT
jgi:hypothetical protein